MARRDKDFGSKLELMERGIGFRFSISAFSNDGLAQLLGTTRETMSRKKIGEAIVTDRDVSVLTHHFGLGRHGFEAGMFFEPLEKFAEHMQRVEGSALGEELVDEDRKLLFDLARDQNGRCYFDQRDTRRGGIGAAKPKPTMPRLREGDEVKIRLTVPDDGHLLVINDDGRRQITLLMPSEYAPGTSVRSGTVNVPTDDEHRYFPVAGPSGPFRVIAVWFRDAPRLLLLKGGHDGEPRDLSTDEFRQLAGLVRSTLKAGRPFKVAVGDYAVIDA